jgi:hypothetical protein
MELEPYSVLQVNAAVIVGLLILLTFQSVSSPFIENEVNDFSTKLSELDIEEKEIILVSKECETRNEYSICSTLDDMFFEFKVRKIAIEDWGKSAGYLDDFGRLTPYMKFLLYLPMYLSVIILLMIFPFIISSVIEGLAIYRGSNMHENQARLGIKLMTIGFITIIVGFTVIMVFVAYASSPFVLNPDTDRDLLFDYREQVLGTDPLNPDTDNDGVIDGLEIDKYHTDPLVADIQNSENER